MLLVRSDNIIYGVNYNYPDITIRPIYDNQGKAPIVWFSHNDRMLANSEFVCFLFILREDSSVTIMLFKYYIALPSVDQAIYYDTVKQRDDGKLPIIILPIGTTAIYSFNISVIYDNYEEKITGLHKDGISHIKSEILVSNTNERYLPCGINPMYFTTISVSESTPPFGSRDRISCNNITVNLPDTIRDVTNTNVILTTNNELVDGQGHHIAYDAITVVRRCNSLVLYLNLSRELICYSSLDQYSEIIDTGVVDVMSDQNEISPFTCYIKTDGSVRGIIFMFDIDKYIITPTTLIDNLINPMFECNSYHASQRNISRTIVKSVNKI